MVFHLLFLCNQSMNKNILLDVHKKTFLKGFSGKKKLCRYSYCIYERENFFFPFLEHSTGLSKKNKLNIFLRANIKYIG